MLIPVNRESKGSMPAIETPGSATVLCVDKTGTLTENRMSVRQLFAVGTSYDVQVHEQLPHQRSLP